MNSHNTLLEQIRNLTLTEPDISIQDNVLKATEYYNETILSVIQCKPNEIQEGSKDKKIFQLLLKKKQNWINYHNKNREEKHETPHDKVYIKNHVNERYKEEPKHRKGNITKDNDNNIILVKNNTPKNKIHPTRVKRSKKYFTGPKNTDIRQRKSNKVHRNTNSGIRTIEPQPGTSRTKNRKS